MYFRGSTDTALTFTSICAADEQSVGISQPHQVLSALQIPFVALFYGQEGRLPFYYCFQGCLTARPAFPHPGYLELLYHWPNFALWPHFALDKLSSMLHIWWDWRQSALGLRTGIADPYLNFYELGVGGKHFGPGRRWRFRQVSAQFCKAVIVMVWEERKRHPQNRALLIILPLSPKMPI